MASEDSSCSSSDEPIAEVTDPRPEGLQVVFLSRKEAVDAVKLDAAKRGKGLQQDAKRSGRKSVVVCVIVSLV